MVNLFHKNCKGSALPLGSQPECYTTSSHTHLLFGADLIDAPSHPSLRLAVFGIHPAVSRPRASAPAVLRLPPRPRRCHHLQDFAQDHLKRDLPPPPYLYKIKIPFSPISTILPTPLILTYFSFVHIIYYLFCVLSANNGGPAKAGIFVLLTHLTQLPRTSAWHMCGRHNYIYWIN